MRGIIPQIIISLFYILIFSLIVYHEYDSPLFKAWLIPFGLTLLLAAISMFFSHLFITGYFNNNKITIFWKMMSSLTSILILYSIFAIQAASV
jgi:hypothetical protein